MRTAVFTHSLVCIRNLTRSLRSLQRTGIYWRIIRDRLMIKVSIMFVEELFPILDQLVRKYRTHTLSSKAFYIK